MNRKTLMTIAVAVVCGLVAVFMVNRYISNRERELNQGMEMIPVIAITTDTKAGQKVTTNVIARRRVPEKYVPTNAISPDDANLVIGQTLLYPMQRGDTLLWTSLSSEAEKLRGGGRFGGLASKITKGERALTIAVDEVAGVAGLVTPNDHIDILCTVRSELDGEESTLTILQNITVLATDQRLSGDIGSKRGYNTLTLLVTLEEAELLVFGQKKGRLVAILRNPEDIDTRQDIKSVTFSDILKWEYRKKLQMKRNTIEVIKKGKTDKNK